MMRGTLQCELKSGGCLSRRAGTRRVTRSRRRRGGPGPNVTSRVLVHDPVARRALSSIRSDRPARERRGRSYDRRQHRNAEASCAGQGGENSPAVSGRGGFRGMADNLLDPHRRRSTPASRAFAQCRTRRATDRAAGYQVWHAAWSEWFASLFSSPACAGLRLRRAPAQVRLRWISSAMCRAAPERKGEVADLAMSGYPDRPHEDQSRW